MPPSELTEEEIREMDQKEFRKAFPSGWMELAQYETNVLIVDTLLQEPPSREFTAGELADKSGASAKSVRSHIDDLVELDVLCKLPNRDSTRYTLNQYSPIVQVLHELNSTVERVKDGELEGSATPPSEYDDGLMGNIEPQSDSASLEPNLGPQV